jgi:hypothetical protein
MALGNFIQGEKPQVVPIEAVIAAWVAQTYNQIRGYYL